MRLTVFGSTGAIGKQLVEQALTAGHQVVAFARNPSKLNVRHERLTIVQGELANQAMQDTKYVRHAPAISNG
jgi:putative NADH-flavin reductase